jgi:hypothetical protein
MVRLEDLEEEKLKRYLGLIDSASDELADLLELLSLAARIEGGRYEPMTREADSLELAPAGAAGTGATVIVDPDAVERSLAGLQLAAARHGGVEVKVTVDGQNVMFEPVVESAAPIVLGEELRDLGAAVAVMLLRSLGSEVALDGERLTVTLPIAAAGTSVDP